MAMKLGIHVYCEKPLTHTVYEARALRELAAKHKVATQMGNQGTSTDGLRRGVEVIQSGALGPVREIHVWTNRPIWPQGNEAILQHVGVHNALHGGGAGPQPPESLKWDIWLGPAPWRPYDPIYLPFNWRGWWDYGTGSLGDMACHTLNLGYWALKLVNPTSVEAEVSELNPESCPLWSIIKYEFPQRGNLPPLKMTWYDKIKKPPLELFEGERMSDSGLMIVGEKGKLYSNGDYGDSWMLLPKKQFEGFKGPDPWIPRSPGHHAEFIRACKGGPPAIQLRLCRPAHGDGRPRQCRHAKTWQEADVGRREPQSHQRRRSEQVRPRGVSRGLDFVVPEQSPDPRIIPARHIPALQGFFSPLPEDRDSLSLA
jgi:predicted dehydrogenase